VMRTLAVPETGRRAAAQFACVAGSITTKLCNRRTER
jgi:hypothetical protein